MTSSIADLIAATTTTDPTLPVFTDTDLDLVEFVSSPEEDDDDDDEECSVYEEDGEDETEPESSDESEKKKNKRKRKKSKQNKQSRKRNNSYTSMDDQVILELVARHGRRWEIISEQFNADPRVSHSHSANGIQQEYRKKLKHVTKPVEILPLPSKPAPSPPPTRTFSMLPPPPVYSRSLPDPLPPLIQMQLADLTAQGRAFYSHIMNNSTNDPAVDLHYCSELRKWMQRERVIRNQYIQQPQSQPHFNHAI